jgi:predicted XRE-type DNA-binding protein
MKPTRKSTFMQWIDGQLARDPEFRRHVEVALTELRLEQDLAALRAARGLSQAQLARLLGVSQPAVAKLESGKAKNLQVKTLVRVATALGGRVRIEIQPAARRRAAVPGRQRRAQPTPRRRS